jgi:hypothetical protein
VRVATDAVDVADEARAAARLRARARRDGRLDGVIANAGFVDDLADSST